MKLRIKKPVGGAIMPTRGNPGDAGIDLYALNDAYFHPGDTVKVNSGISMEIPQGYVGLIWDKSGVSYKQGLKVMGGVIDSSYRGEVVVTFHNTTSIQQKIERGSKMAQMIIQKYEEVELEVVDELSETQRGDGGFGSTGI